MDFKLINKANFHRRIAVFCCALINFLAAFFAYKTGLPLYLDTIGTMLSVFLGGLFPGVLTSVITNAICGLFNPNSLYYSIINVIVAICTAYCINTGFFKKKINIPVFVVIIAMFSGIFSICFQWILLGGPQFEDVSDIAMLMSNNNKAGYFFSAMLVNIGLNIIDKGISIVLAQLIFKAIPDKIKRLIKRSGWKQNPLSEEDMQKYGRLKNRNTLFSKVSVLLILFSTTMALAMSWVSIKVYINDIMDDYTRNAVNCSEFVAKYIDPDKIPDYLMYGDRTGEYQETEQLLEDIRANSPCVEYIYVVRIEKDGVRFIFDLDTPEEPGYDVGVLVPFEDAFEPYINKLYAGEEIDPIISDDSWGHLITSYSPIRDRRGRTVAYAAADVSLAYTQGYVRDFLTKAVLIFSGFFIVIIEFGLSVAGYSLVYPIGSMTECARGFIKSDGNQAELDANVRRIRSLDIRTGDEVEELYNTLCRMEIDIAEQVRDLRHYADATAKMQNGLIITMADMVENRDSDTGAHVQKTAAYVKIILDGLKRKGYYAEKLTPKYMNDVEMSAPLHDVGKINIPDGVLNKPGKLTDEEFEIMKTHTTAGEHILENAIAKVEGESYLKEARNMAAYHHERWDGKGYPYGLHGEAIPLSARIMAVADVFDALTSPRIYKKAFPLEKTLKIITDAAGSQFDPKCVEVFMESINEVKRVLRKYNPQE